MTARLHGLIDLRAAWLAPAAAPARRGGAVKAEVALMAGCVLETHKGGFHTVALENGGIVLARRAGRMVLNRIRVVAGDRVTVELSAYDASRDRIVRRQ